MASMVNVLDVCQVTTSPAVTQTTGTKKSSRCPQDLKPVEITITNKKVGKYFARSYPVDRADDNGLTPVYDVDLFEIWIGSAENKSIFIEKGYRFTPVLETNGTWIAGAGLQGPLKVIVKRYKPDYKIHNSEVYKDDWGAIVIKDTFYIHYGADNEEDEGAGAKGCVGIIGSFKNFKKEINIVSGYFKGDDSSEELNKGILCLVEQRKLKITIQYSQSPSFNKNQFKKKTYLEYAK